MKKLIYQLCACFLPMLSMAQIPNPDFEQWQTTQIEMPQQWGIFGITKKVPGYSGNYAVRLERDPNNTNAPGAVIYGNPDENFSGGIPFADRPDSVVIYVKRHLPTGDSAWFLVNLRRGGESISTNNFRFGGSDSNNFVRMAFAIPYSDTGLADSLVIGVSSTDPEMDFVGSFVVLDSIHFVGGLNVKIPNGNFESWTTVTLEEPLGWFTSNRNMQVSSSERPVEKSTDAALHQFSVRIQNIEVGDEFRQGYIMAGKQGDNGPLPGFALGANDTILYAYYKCFPVNGDVINIGIFVFDSGMMVGSGFLRQPYTISTWSQTAIPIEYYFGYTGTPDSAVIFCSAFGGGDDAKGNSVLFVDGLRFNEPFTKVNTYAETQGLLTIFPNPGNDIVSIRYSGLIGEQTTFEIHDLYGNVVYKTDVESLFTGLNTTSLSTEALNSGTFILYMKNGNYNVSRLFVVSH